MTTRRSMITSAASLGVAALLTPALIGRAQAATRLKAYTYLPTIERSGAAGLEDLGTTFVEATGGTYDVELNLGGSLPIGGSDITQAVGDGVIDIAGNGFFHGSVPIGGILRLPMLMTDMGAFFQARDIVMPHMEAAFARQGVTVIGAYVYPPQVAWSRDPLASLDDLAGKKMRVTSAEQGAFVEAFGGSPVTIPSAEVAPALQRGVVDGVFTASIGGGAAWKDLLSHSFRLGISYFDSVIIVNTEVLDAMSDDHRAALMSLGQEAGEAITARMEEEEPAMTQTLAEGGMTIVDPTADEVAEANARMADFWDSWAAETDAETQAVLGDVRESLAA